MFFSPVHLSGTQWLVVPFIVFGRYAVICLLLFSLFYVWKRRDWLRLKIQQRFPNDADYWREIGFSALTSVIFGVVVWLCLGTSFREHTQFYRDIHQHSIWWLIVSVPLTLLVHDTYFYWIHRLMHHPVLYRRVHLTHHKSVNPSPWAAYAFHPIEAVLEAGIIPLLLVIMPLHPISFFAFVTLMLWFNIYGHLGYELYPRKIYQHPLGKWLNSTIYHNLHHEKFHGNYCLYFSFWDRVCGTLRADSQAKVEEVHGRAVDQKQSQSLFQTFKLNIMNIRHFLLLFASACAAPAGYAQAPVNWATDIAPILYERPNDHQPVFYAYRPGYPGDSPCPLAQPHRALPGKRPARHTGQHGENLPCQVQTTCGRVGGQCGPTHAYTQCWWT